MSLFGKTRLAVLSVANSLLDKVIDLNSVEAVRQNIRDIEVSRDSLSDSVATARGYVTGVKREVSQLATERDKLNRQIDTLLTDDDSGNDHRANTLEAKLVGVESLLAMKQEEMTSGQETAHALEQTYSTLQTRLTTMVSQLSRLEAMDRSAKAKEGAATAMRQAAKASTTGAEVSVDSVAARIQRRSDVADEKLRSASGDFATVTDKDETLANVAARLAVRKKRLAGKAS